MILGLILLVQVEPVGALTVNTSTEVAELRGTEVELTLTLVATGVGQESETPLGTSTVAVGNSVDLGTISDTPTRPTQLLVELPDGTFYRTVRPGELRNGIVELQIHEKGPSDSLRVQEHSVLVQPFPNRMMIREVVVFRNPTDHRVGGEDSPVEIDLPEGATRFNPGPGFGTDADYRLEDGKLTYNVQLAPGRSIIGFFYLVMPEGNQYTMVRRPSWPTDRFIVNTMTGDSVSVSTEGFRSVTNPRGRAPSGRADQYVAESVSVGQQLSLTWNGLNNMSPPGSMGDGATPPMAEGPTGEQATSDNQTEQRPSSLSSVSWPVFIGIGISLLVFAGSYGYVQFHLKELDPGLGEEFLIEEIARLDQEFEDGAIDEAYYNRTRRRWKSKAHEMRDDNPPDSRDTT